MHRLIAVATGALGLWLAPPATALAQQPSTAPPGPSPCRLPPAACRLPPAACRLPPADGGYTERL
jgi:hypothetical protein